MFNSQSRLPYSVDVTCNHKDCLDSFIPSFNFMVILNQYVFGFKEVSGIDKDYPYKSISEGGNSYPIFSRNRSDPLNFEEIRLKRGMLIRGGTVASSAIRAAFAQAVKLNNNLARKSALIAAAALDPFSTLENGPAYGFIQVFDRAYSKDCATFSFFSHGAYKWSMSDLDATDHNFLYEEITLICSDLKQMSTSLVPSGFWNVIGEDDHSYYEPLSNEEYEKRYGDIDSIMKKTQENKKNFETARDNKIEAQGNIDDDFKEIDNKKGSNKKEFETARDEQITKEKVAYNTKYGDDETINKQKDTNRKDFFIDGYVKPEDIADEIKKRNKEAIERAKQIKIDRDERIKEFEEKMKKQKSPEGESEKAKDTETKAEESIDGKFKKIDEEKKESYKKFETARDKKIKAQGNVDDDFKEIDKKKGNNKKEFFTEKKDNTPKKTDYELAKDAKNKRDERMKDVEKRQASEKSFDDIEKEKQDKQKEFEQKRDKGK